MEVLEDLYKLKFCLKSIGVSPSVQSKHMASKDLAFTAHSIQNI